MRVYRHRLAAVGMGLAVLCGCGGSEGKPGTRRPEGAKDASVRPAELRPMARTISVTGTLAARETSLLSAKVAGRLQQLNVDLGSAVREGELLAQIEPRDFELGLAQAAAALAQARTALGLPAAGAEDQPELEQVSAVRQAKAVLEEATSNRERVRRLSQAGIASRAELDVVEAVFKVAQSKYDTALEEARTRMAAISQRRAEFELAGKQLADASVRAPFAGAVQSRPAHLGEYMAIGAPIVELVTTNPLRLRLQVPERQCALVCTGQTVHLRVEGDTNIYAGKIARLSPALEDQSRMLRVEADVPAKGTLRPGLFARADIVVKESETSLSVSASALVTFAGIEKVITIQEGKAVEKVVVTGRRGADWVEVVSGIAPGEEVVLNPGGLRTGQPVNRIPGDSGMLGKGEGATASGTATN